MSIEKARKALERDDLTELQRAAIEMIYFKDFRNTGIGSSRRADMPPAVRPAIHKASKMEGIKEVMSHLQSKYPLQAIPLLPVDDDQLSADYLDLYHQGFPDRLQVYFPAEEDLEGEVRKCVRVYGEAIKHARQDRVRNLRDCLETLSTLTVRLYTHKEEMERLEQFGEKVHRDVYFNGPSANPTHLTCDPMTHTGELYDVMTFLKKRLSTLARLDELEGKKLYMRAAKAFFSNDIEV